MKNRLKQRLYTVFAVLFSFLITMPVFAVNKSETVIRDSYIFQNSTIYLEEAETYRIVFTIHQNGKVDYSVCYKNNPGVVYSGDYNNQSINARSTDGVLEITAVLLDLAPQRVEDYAMRPVVTGVNFSENDAIELCRDYAPGWRTPASSIRVGTYTSDSLQVIVSESVNGDARQIKRILYYLGDPVEALVALIDGATIEEVLEAVSSIYNSGGEIVAECNGTLNYYRVDNTRTKIATIAGSTYYWAGWDMVYSVCSGDKGVSVDRYYEYKHPDYSNSVSYFGQKAIDSYNNG